jgi:hypothetical protein
MGMFSWLKRRSDKDANSDAIEKFRVVCSLNLMRALDLIGHDDKVEDVRGLLIDPVAIGYVYGAPIQFARQFLANMEPNKIESFVDCSLQPVFTDTALQLLKSKFIELSTEQNQGIIEGVNLAMRDVQRLASVGAGGISMSELPEGYMIRQ